MSTYLSVSDNACAPTFLRHGAYRLSYNSIILDRHKQCDRVLETTCRIFRVIRSAFLASLPINKSARCSPTQGPTMVYTHVLILVLCLCQLHVPVPCISPEISMSCSCSKTFSIQILLLTSTSLSQETVHAGAGRDASHEPDPVTSLANAQ